MTIGYDHVQRGYLHFILHGLSLGLILAAVLTGNLLPSLVLVGAALLFGLLGLAFHYLRVMDDGDALSVRFGPLPLMRKRIPYVDITEVERGRTNLLDGWGVHYMPWRGWTWNLWGSDCVRLRVNGKTLRIGSDAPDELAAFVRQRSAARVVTPTS